jgi:hypothetical protein
MSMHGVRMFTEPVFSRGRHGQESEEDREGSHQEGGKEDLKEKEVAVSATEKSPPPGRNPDQSETSPKDLKCPLQPLGIAAKHYKAGPLCNWLLHKGPVFRFGPGRQYDLFLRKGSMPHGRDALAARFTRARSAKCGCTPTTSSSHLSELPPRHRTLRQISHHVTCPPSRNR